MSKKSTFLAIFMVFLISFSSRADDVKLYFGHDHHFRKMEFSESLGKKMLKDVSNHKVLFGGIKFTDEIGAEFGHGVTRFKPYNSLFRRWDTVNGSQICVRGRCNHNIYKSSGKLTENYFDIVFRTIACNQDHLKFSTSIGVSFNKIDITRKLTDFGMFQVNIKDRKFIGHRANLRLGMGFEYMIHDNIGLRNKISWINTRTIRAPIKDFDMPAGLSSKEYAYKPRDSVLYSLGVFAEF